MFCLRLARNAAVRVQSSNNYAYLSSGPRKYLCSTANRTETIANETYQRALEASKEAKEFERHLEEKRNRQQFETWERSQERQLRKPASAGVAVIKTIAKQTRTIDKDSDRVEVLKLTARTLLEEAALKYKHPIALVRLGNDIIEKEKDGIAVEKALEYYRQAGEEGSSEGWFNLGHFLWNRADEIPAKNFQSLNAISSMEAFWKAIELEDADAMYFVGVQYMSEEESSNGNKYREGLELITTAAQEKGHNGALYYLSLFYYNGFPELQIAPSSTTDFIQRLDAAAEAGNADALFLRGHNFYHGDDGRKQDYTQALDNFLLAADAGHADAAVSAGAMLHKGVGREMDQQKAFQLYQLGGELGSIEGWRNVVACYALGEGVAHSKSTAEYIANTMLKDVNNEHDGESNGS